MPRELGDLFIENLNLAMKNLEDAGAQRQSRRRAKLKELSEGLDQDHLARIVSPISLRSESSPRKGTQAACNMQASFVVLPGNGFIR